VKDHDQETKIPTFQPNISVVSKLNWLEHDLNLSYAYLEKRSLDCQLGTGVGSHVTVRNQSDYENDESIILDTAKWTNVSRFQWTRSHSLNLLDLCLTPASSLRMSSRTDIGRLLIKSTDISTGLYRVRSEIMIDPIYLSNEYSRTSHNRYPFVTAKKYRLSEVIGFENCHIRDL
jgi:hypothetical protein